MARRFAAAVVAAVAAGGLVAAVAATGLAPLSSADTSGTCSNLSNLRESDLMNCVALHVLGFSSCTP